jgi:luciferase family oxidoreductase group 1
MPPLRLSVLDQSPIVEGSTGAQALTNTLDLARHVDRLGYTRYWLAEHHGIPSLAGTSPEALVGPVAAATERIRVGSGGVMLPYYSPLKVAETFSVLSGLYPGRIDLGLGRAPGGDTETLVALQRQRGAPFGNDFADQLVELLAWLRGRIPEDHPWARLTTLPGRPETPEVWLLGSSPDSATWAAQLGLAYAFADFINPHGAELAASYCERFEPGERDEPAVAVGVAVVCAETDDEAERLASSTRMSFSLLRQGKLIQVPPVEKALRYFEQQGRVPGGRRMIVGSPETARRGIEEVAAAYVADEVIVLTITYEHEQRKRSYELLARAFALG